MERSPSRQLSMRVHRSMFRIGKKCYESSMWIKLPFFKVIVFGKEVVTDPAPTDEAEKQQRILDFLNMERRHRIPIVEPARAKPWIVRVVSKFFASLREW